MAKVTRRIKIVNEKGLHARASAKFVETVEHFEADVTVAKDGLSAGGDSVMALLMLAAACGETIEVTCDGADAESAMKGLETLVADRFGEAM